LAPVFWIAPDAPSFLARVEASQSADLNLVPGTQGTADASGVIDSHLKVSDD
jgi:hypothetical protein